MNKPKGFAINVSSSSHLSEDSGLTIVRRLSGKKSQQHQSEQPDNQLEQYFNSDSQPCVTSGGFQSFIENRLTMQPTSVNDSLDSLDLTTENLPAVDTPDACDKAAMRYVRRLSYPRRRDVPAPKS